MAGRKSEYMMEQARLRPIPVNMKGIKERYEAEKKCRTLSEYVAVLRRASMSGNQQCDRGISLGLTDSR